MAQLRASGANVVGIVLNRVRRRKAGRHLRLLLADRTCPRAKAKRRWLARSELGTCCANPSSSPGGTSAGGRPKKASVRRNVATNYLVAVVSGRRGFHHHADPHPSAGHPPLRCLGAHRLAHPVPRAPRAGVCERHRRLRQPAPRTGRRREGRRHAQHVLPVPFCARDHRVRGRHRVCDLPSRPHHEHPQEPGRPGAVPRPAPRIRHGGLHPHGHVRRSAVRAAAVRPLELQPDRGHRGPGDRLGHRPVAPRRAHRSRYRDGRHQPGRPGVASGDRAPPAAVVPSLAAPVRPEPRPTVHLGIGLVLGGADLRRGAQLSDVLIVGAAAGVRAAAIYAVAQRLGLLPAADRPTADQSLVHQGRAVGGP